MPLPTDYVGSNRVNARSNNRMIPLSSIYHATFTDVPTAVTNGVSLSHVGASAAGTTNMTLGGSLASGGIATLNPPRNVVITVTHASAVVAMSGTITGTDVAGKAMTEAWSVTAGTTTKTFTGKKAFKTVTQITETIAATAAGNTIIAGTGTVLGVPVKVTSAVPLQELVNGSAVTTGTFVKNSSVSTDDPLGTYSPATAPNGTNDYEAYLLTDDPWNS